MPAATSLTRWNPYEYKIDNSSALGEGRFLSGAFTMIAAGPPRLSSIAGGAISSGVYLDSNLPATQSQYAIPIGLVQNFNLGQNKQFSRFFELGSERSYFIAGRTTAQASFSRVMYNGPSLLRMMYAYYTDLIAPTVVLPFGMDPSMKFRVSNFSKNVKLPPGYENIYLNLASDLFSQPCGLLVYLKDSNETTAGAIYLEETYLPSHQISTSSDGVVIQESVSLQPERVVPIRIPSSTTLAASELSPFGSASFQTAITGPGIP